MKSPTNPTTTKEAIDGVVVIVGRIDVRLATGLRHGVGIGVERCHGVVGRLVAVDGLDVERVALLQMLLVAGIEEHWKLMLESSTREIHISYRQERSYQLTNQRVCTRSPSFLKAERCSSKVSSNLTTLDLIGCGVLCCGNLLVNTAGFV